MFTQRRQRVFLVVWVCSCAFFLSLASAQQTLGGNVRTLSDLSGAMIVDGQVTLVTDATKRTRAQRTSGCGGNDFVSLPIEWPVVGLVFATAFSSRPGQQGSTNPIPRLCPRSRRQDSREYTEPRARRTHWIRGRSRKRQESVANRYRPESFCSLQQPQCQSQTDAPAHCNTSKGRG